jgi:hypothetical protein
MYRTLTLDIATSSYIMTKQSGIAAQRTRASAVTPVAKAPRTIRSHAAVMSYNQAERQRQAGVAFANAKGMGD